MNMAEHNQSCQPFGWELRFSSLEQYSRYCNTRDLHDTVSPFITCDGKIVTNPEYVSAPYCERMVFMDRRRFVLDEKKPC